MEVCLRYYVQGETDGLVVNIPCPGWPEETNLSVSQCLHFCKVGNQAAVAHYGVGAFVTVIVSVYDDEVYRMSGTLTDSGTIVRDLYTVLAECRHQLMCYDVPRDSSPIFVNDYNSLIQQIKAFQAYL